jgi:hypothetical protein
MNKITNPGLVEVKDKAGVRSFSGPDIVAYAFFPYLQEPVKLGWLALFSWGTMRTKSMVGSLGKLNGRGFTRGMRVVTGVMVFLQLDRSAFSPLTDNHIRNKFAPYQLTTKPDEMPPFDLLLTYVAEDGSASFRTVKHVEIVQAQGTDSVDEINPQESYSFVALDISPLIPLSKIRERWSSKDKPSTNNVFVGRVRTSNESVIPDSLIKQLVDPLNSINVELDDITGGLLNLPGVKTDNTNNPYGLQEQMGGGIPNVTALPFVSVGGRDFDLDTPYLSLSVSDRNYLDSNLPSLSGNLSSQNLTLRKAFRFAGATPDENLYFYKNSNINIPLDKKYSDLSFAEKSYIQINLPQAYNKMSQTNGTLRQGLNVANGNLPTSGLNVDSVSVQPHFIRNTTALDNAFFDVNGYSAPREPDDE